MTRHPHRKQNAAPPAGADPGWLPRVITGSWEPSSATTESEAAKAARVSFSEAHALGPERSAEALRIYRELMKKHARAKEFTLRGAFACASFNAGVRLDLLKRKNEAIKAFDRLFIHSAGAAEAPLRKWAVEGRIRKGQILYQLGRLTDAAFAFEQALASSDLDHDRREEVSKALDCLQAEISAVQRQNAALSRERDVQDGGVSGEPTTPVGAAAQPRPRSTLQVPEAGHRLTRSQAETLAGVAATLCQPRAASLLAVITRNPEAAFNAADNILAEMDAAERNVATSETNSRSVAVAHLGAADNQPEPLPQSPAEPSRKRIASTREKVRKAQFAEVERILLRQLPRSLARKRAPRKPEEELTLFDEAQRIVSRYDRDHKNGVKYGKAEMKAVRVARNFVRQTQRDSEL